MHGLTWRLLKLGIVISSIFILMFGWYASSQANAGASILVVVNDSSSNSNKFGRYLGEILRAEGLNSFEIIDISALTAGTLTDHDLTILAETSLTTSQANLLNNYVNNSSGHLLAMRPDSQIKDLFGLGTANGNLVNGYVKINTTAVLSGSIPGQGLTSATLQIHGNANQYTPTSGAVVLAQLYSNATTSTSYPAVISAVNGRAIAFTYDLVRNVVYTRQGNPANADVDTDSDGTVRTIDLFQTSGGGAPWVDRDKIPVPQADEQQRLFARLVKQMVGEVRPMPQLWYFPGTAKTMLILTGDAHGNPTSSYQNELNSLNARGGKISLYLSIAADPPESQAGGNNDVTDWRAQGHTFGIHPYKYSPNPSYPPYDIQNLAEGYDVYGTWFGQQYPNTPKSRTERNHQVAWLGWTDAAEIAASRGYGLDTNFYHWGAWLKKADNSWPHGYITGSGQPMKFVRDDGQIINLYQQLTQLVDEQMIGGAAYEGLSGAQAVGVSQQLIDASEGGDYAALMTQFHVDYYSGEAQVWAEGTLDYANSQGVPIWNADQWLSFTETRHDASFTDIAWNDTTKILSFNLSAAVTPGVNLTTILPLEYRGNNLQSVSVDSVQTTYSVETIKGIDEAFVTVPAGNHTINAAYGPVVGVSIIQMGGSTLVSENGLTDTYQVKLTSAPVAPVRINFVTNAQLNALSPITFTSLTWNIPQTVIVSAVNDALIEGAHTSIISHTTASTDPAYNNLSVTPVNVSIIDNDAPGIEITESGGTTDVFESGVTDTYQLKLTTLPTASVRINFITDAQLNALGAITFTTLNWNIPQTVTVSAVDDTLAEGPHSSLINHTATSSDPNYNGLFITLVNVNIDDNDTADVSVAPTSISVAESGITATYGISLTTQPAADVQISFTTDAQLNPINPITFTTLNWNSPQIVTVSAVDDALVEGTHSSVISHISTSADSAYDGLAIDPVNITIADNDAPLPTGSITTTTTYTDFLQACNVLTGTFPAPLLTNTFVSDLNGGMVTLAALFADDFSGATLDSQWQPGNWSGANSATLSGGILNLPTGVYVRSQSSYNYGVIEAIAEFGLGIDQHIGFADSAFASAYFIFSTRPFDGNLYARVNSGSGEQNAPLGPIPTGLHRYRVEWKPLDASNDQVSFYLDGVFQVQFTVAKAVTNVSLWLTNNGPANLRVDAVQVSPPYVPTGSYTSCVFDAYQLGEGNKWGKISWDAVLAAATGLTVEARTSSDGSVWSNWVTAPTSGSNLVSPDRYAQYRLLLSTTDVQTSTLVNSVTLDLASPLLSIADTSVTEGNSGSVNAVFTATLSISSSKIITVSYATADNTAGSPADYLSQTGIVTFAPGVITQTILVPVQGDTLDETDETFQVNLSSPVNADLDNSLGLGTILDDDLPPTVNVNDAVKIEGNFGSVPAVFTATLSAASSLTISVNYSTTALSATAGVDYLNQTDTLTFTPGVTTAQFAIPVNGDTLDEFNETFQVNLSNPVNVTIGDGQGLGTIIDDDNPPDMTIADVSLTEGNVGLSNAVFTVTLSAVSGLTVTVDYATANGIAMTPADYLSQSGTLTFTPGVTNQGVTVPVQGDTLNEADETFLVNLSNNNRATLVDSQGQGTILNDDALPNLSITNASVSEGNSGTVSAVFTVTLSAASGQTVTVNYATTDNIATSPADYVSKNGILTFTPGVTSQLVSVTVNGDQQDEANEIFNVNLSAPVNASLPAGPGIGTILNDDSAGVTVNPVAVNVAEGGLTATYAISLTSQPTATVTIAVNPDSQLTVNSTSVLFNAANWNTAQTITVTAVNDFVVEGLHLGIISHTATSTDNNYNNIAVNNVTASITDNDTAGVSVAPTAVAVTEGGITATYAISLTSQPTAAVTIAVNPDSQINGVPVGLNFTALNWNIPQTVTVTAVDDAVAEGTHTGVISHTAVSSDSNYNGLTIGNVTATIADNDTAGVNVTPKNVSVTEGGPVDTYNVVLTSQPTGLVTITLSTGGQTTVEPAFLTFTTLTWQNPQTITVTAVDDVVAEGLHADVISHTATSSDSNYAGIPISNVSVSVTDNDAAGVIVTPGNVTVAEAGITDTYQIKLATQPTQAVTVTLAPGGQTNVSPLSLNFTPLNWSTPQTVTVTAVDDLVAEGVHTDVISHTASSADNEYSGIAVSQVTATISDNDTAGVKVTPTSVTVTEGGATDPYTVVLNSQPTSVVTVSITTGGQTTVAPSSLAFSPLTWNKPQTVTVTAVDDLIVEGTHGDSISHSAASADSNYNGASINNVAATITDNDTAEVSVAPTLVNVAEGGITATYAISLTSQPTASVTVTVTTDGQTGVTPTTMVFNQFNWFWPQLVEVTAVDDALAEGPHTSTISHAVTSADSNYNGLSATNITANISDNDTTGVTVTPATLALSENGITDTYRIVLNSQPGQPVTITVVTDGQTTVVPSSIHFTSLNWNNAQTVTVTAVDDLLAEGTHTGIISHTVASADSNYAGIPVSYVTANIADNDVAAVSLVPTNLTATEGSLTATYAISLTSQPISNVTVTLTPDSQVSVNPGGLTFTPSNWNVSQVITVTAVDDALVEGNHNGVISHTVSSADPNYNGLAVNNVTITITDNDPAGGGSNQKIFLPIILGNSVQSLAAPDLVIQSVNVSNSSLQLTIKNQGNAAVTTDFWVDVYLNPQPVPTGINHVWNDGRSTYGAVWGVKASTLPMAAGATLTLSVGDANYWPSLSSLPKTLGTGTKVYAQVDSANLNTNYGGVWESHEIMGQSYNNIFGPVLSTASTAGNLLALESVASSSTSVALSPPRP